MQGGNPSRYSLCKHHDDQQNMRRNAFVRPSSKPLMPILEVLHSYKDCGKWDHLSVDGDGKWTWEGIATGLVVIAHDGSYMATEAPDLCSASVVLFCRERRKWLKASATEGSPSASNYCGKLLGAIMSLLILRAASSTLLLCTHPLFCIATTVGLSITAIPHLCPYPRSSIRQISLVTLDILQEHHRVNPHGSG
jgi:hypothetical protein